jgi:hypothetical protein
MWSEFNNWVLGRIEISEKIAILSQMAEFLDVKQQAAIAELFKGLNRMIERRNDLAHGHYMKVVEISDAGRLELDFLVRMHRKSGHLDPNALKELQPRDLEGELAALERLVPPLTDLFNRAFRMWPTKSTRDGVTRDVPGNLEELEEKQRQRRARLAAQQARNDEREARKAARRKQGPQR